MFSPRLNRRGFFVGAPVKPLEINYAPLVHKILGIYDEPDGSGREFATNAILEMATLADRYNELVARLERGEVWDSIKISMEL